VDFADNAYCFSPATRELIVVSPGGSLQWSKVIPGSNVAEIVQAVSVIDGTAVLAIADSLASGLIDLRIVAHNATDTLWELRIDPFNRLAGNRTLYSPRLNYANQELLTVGTLTSLFIAVPWHELVAGGDPNQAPDWTLKGTLIVQVDTGTGNSVSYRHVSGTLDSMELLSDDSIAVEINNGGFQLLPNSLRTDSGSSASLLTINSLPEISTSLLRELQGGFQRKIMNQVYLINQQLNVDVGLIDWPCDAYSNDDPANCVFFDTLGPQTIACPDSGSVTRSVSAMAEYLPGATSLRTDLDEYTYSNCKLQISGIDGLADGTYTLQGNYETERIIGGVVSGSYSQARFEFDTFEMQMPAGGVAAISGSETYQVLIDGFREREWDIVVDSYVSGATSISNLTYHQDEDTSPPAHGLRELLTLGGSMQISSPLTEGQLVSYDIVPSLSASYAGGVGSLGGNISIVASDGSFANLALTADASNGDLELLDLYLQNDSGTSVALLPVGGFFNPTWWAP